MSDRNNFTLVGRVVTHTTRPRFTATFSPREDGGFDGVNAWLDGPPVPEPGESAAKFAGRLARLSREAGDYFAAHLRDDWIQAAVIARAEEMKMTSYEIARRTGWAISEDHVRVYLTKDKSMGSHKLQHVLSVLGMKIGRR